MHPDPSQAPVMQRNGRTIDGYNSKVSRVNYAQRCFLDVLQTLHSRRVHCFRIESFPYPRAESAHPVE